MKMIQGLIALVLVAAAVFVAVVIYNNKTEPAYVAKIHQQTASLTQGSALMTHKSPVLAGRKS